MKAYEFAPNKNCLAHLTTKDGDAKRLQPIDNDEDAPLFEVLSPFAIDGEQKLLPSKSVRRMQAKTAVFTGNVNLHIRTRLTHSFEVENLALILAQILGLNVALARAGARGHDIGHTPFGHLGENFIRAKTGTHFEHSIFGTVVAERIERRGRGLNLTQQTLDCIASHSKGKGKLTPVRDKSPEANVVMLADKIAFIFSDANDIFCRLRMFENGKGKIKRLLNYFGLCQRERNLRVIDAIVRESADAGFVSFEQSDESQKFHELKTLMYDEIYFQLHWAELGERLENAWRVIQRFECCAKIDPLLIIALMTDLEALQFTDDNDAVTEENFASFSVAEIIGDSREALEKIKMTNLPKII